MMRLTSRLSLSATPESKSICHGTEIIYISTWTSTPCTSSNSTSLIPIEFACEMWIRLFLYPAIRTEYIDDNSMYSETLAVHMAVHPGGAVAIT